MLQHTCTFTSDEDKCGHVDDNDLEETGINDGEYDRPIDDTAFDNTTPIGSYNETRVPGDISIHQSPVRG